MELTPRLRKKSLGRILGFGLCLIASPVTKQLPASAGTPAAIADADDLIDSEAEALADGLEHEKANHWAEAVRHYSDAAREYPSNRTLYQRLLISRLHLDVNRRYQDTSFLQSVNTLTTRQALDLYAEVLANLQTHYVEQVDWNRVQTHGTAALEVALTQGSFINRVNPTATPEQIESFRQSVHREFVNRNSATRYDLRANVAHVASLAHAKLGISGTATVLEYVGGAISTLDTYTRLLSGNQLDEMFSNIEGNFVGLGIELKPETDSLKILSVIPGGPAADAGITAGDHIIGVAGQMTNVVAPDLAADMLRGPEKSSVSLTLRDVAGNERILRVERRRVDVPCVEDVRLVDPDAKTGYLRLSAFQKTTTRDVERALWDLHRQGMRSLIIDVRGNPGGLLSAAVEVADRFLSDGRIVTTRGRNVRENFEYTAKTQNTWNVPLVVLIDHDSASASEIFAGAIGDSHRGVVIGETSYGKGSVQGIFRMQSAKFGLCLTTAKFYSPSGRAISDNGVQPDVFVEPKYAVGRPDGEGNFPTTGGTAGSDPVLKRAILQLTEPELISQRR